MYECEASESATVLPLKLHNRLVFPLCMSCAEERLSDCHCKRDVESNRILHCTRMSCELQKAVYLGYTISKISVVWQ